MATPRNKKGWYILLILRLLVIQYFTGYIPKEEVDDGRGDT